eukprot:824842-Pyramimonas_sp.AAC.1
MGCQMTRIFRRQDQRWIRATAPPEHLALVRDASASENIPPIGPVRGIFPSSEQKLKRRACGSACACGRGSAGRTVVAFAVGALVPSR